MSQREVNIRFSPCLGGDGNSVLVDGNDVSNLCSGVSVDWGTEYAPEVVLHMNPNVISVSGVANVQVDVDIEGIPDFFLEALHQKLKEKFEAE